MADRDIRFSDGASYEAMMGGWSRSVGEGFLEWMHAPSACDWIDVGCGSGAFTQLVAERCNPRSILGIDPSGAQLAFARKRGLAPVAKFELGDAMQLDVPDGTMDVAVAALVVHFMPDPELGIREMARVVRPGGIVAAYAWDLGNGGFPYGAAHKAMDIEGVSVPPPPHPEAADASELGRLWQAAGLAGISQRQFEVSRTFEDAEDYWRTATKSPRIAAAFASAPGDVVARIRGALAGELPVAADGTVTTTARANAIFGRVPA